MLKLNSVTVNTETKSPHSDRRAPFHALIVSLGKKVIIYSALLLNKDHIPVTRRVFLLCPANFPDDELIVKKKMIRALIFSFDFEIHFVAMAPWGREIQLGMRWLRWGDSSKWTKNERIVWDQKKKTNTQKQKDVGVVWGL